jgi:subtilisin-like proprotein convertase family protein
MGLLIAGSGPARADMAGLGAGGPIPNNSSAGISSIISFAVNEEIVDLEVTIDFGPIVNGVSGHTFLGDLSAQLMAPDGTTISLFDRPGVPATGNGDNSNLAGLYSWSDSGTSFTAAAAAVGNNQTVANAIYLAQDANDGVLSFATAFLGKATVGNWTLKITDQKNRDAGGFLNWSLNIQSNQFVAVPETSSTLVLVVATVIAAGSSGKQARRRRTRIHRAWY